jgi:hypothetical protein
VTALVRQGFVAEASANWSRWVVRCGQCPNAGQLHPLTRRGRYDPPPYFACTHCLAITEVIWPSEDMVKGVERLLMMRPDPSTRNWVPGETLHDLIFENGAHGIFDNIGEGLPPGVTLFAVEDDRIRADALPSLKPRIRQEIAQ